MGMQIAFGLATSADIDPPADFHGGDRWTVTSEWKEIGTRPFTCPSVGFSLCLASLHLFVKHPSFPHAHSPALWPSLLFFASCYRLTEEVRPLTERLQVKSLQMPTVIDRCQTSKPVWDVPQDQTPKVPERTFAAQNNLTGFRHLIKEMGVVCAGETLSPPSVTQEAHRMIERFTVYGSSSWSHLYNSVQFLLVVQCE